MKRTKMFAYAALVGAVISGAGAGLAHAAPPGPPGPPGPPPPIPGGPGPGANVGGPGNPLPPGQGYLPPPGHLAQIDGVVPAWAPPPPPPPPWAPWLPVVWNADLPGWGVWWNGGFIRL
ncbi:hypothetical protein B1R94_20030 [Mycolicibacterium litorale]|nr:hypothetical protein B1R94_20030 [Mycolicibacterium litorale]